MDIVDNAVDGVRVAVAGAFLVLFLVAFAAALANMPGGSYATGIVNSVVGGVLLLLGIAGVVGLIKLVQMIVEAFDDFGGYSGL
jgi:hypothetical protein